MKLLIIVIGIGTFIIFVPYIKDTIKSIVRDILDTAYGRTNKLGGDVKYRADLDTGINPTGRLKDHPWISDTIKEWVRSGKEC